MAVAESDAESILEINRELDSLSHKVASLEIRQTLSGEHDKGNAILTIHPGAGGTESQDWAEMLLRMYARFAEKEGYKSELIDIQPGEEAGIKSATLTIKGEYAYGYLKAESGIHRLVRISPFDASKRRHTSFASVFVFPELDEDVNVEINEKDLKIDTYRASGAGGQHVNRTDSAVRITHIPSKIVVQCQNDRSQHKNRATAMKVLKARLYEFEKQKKKEEVDTLSADKKDIGWGNQIRSYVLHPYRMVKDIRTNLQTGNTDSVLDGGIMQFMEAYLTSGTDRNG
jgi:peptide chain release factor 2